MARSPRILSTARSAVILIDLQEKLLPKIAGHPHVRWNCERIARAARTLGVPLFATEQYPQGLGVTVEPLTQLFPHRSEKMSFSVAGCEPWLTAFQAHDFEQVLLCGIETHVCILQSALDLQALGYDVFLPIDASGSRSPEDHGIAAQRLRSEGISITTTESVLFEWCQTAAHPQFAEIRKLVMQTGPADAHPIGFSSALQKIKH